MSNLKRIENGGSTFICEVDDKDCPYGIGIKLSQTGLTEFGHFNHTFQIEPPGMILYPDGNVLIHGDNVGEYYFKDSGDRYEGEIDPRSFERTGVGIYNWSNGSTFSGEFVKGSAFGLGILELTRFGTTYFGEVHHNQPHGHGCRFFRNGFYQGQFFHGHQKGYGCFSNGKIESRGLWDADRLSQAGTFNGAVPDAESAAIKAMEAARSLTTQVRRNSKRVESITAIVVKLVKKLRGVREDFGVHLNLEDKFNFLASVKPDFNWDPLPSHPIHLDPSRKVDDRVSFPSQMTHKIAIHSPVVLRNQVSVTEFRRTDTSEDIETGSGNDSRGVRLSSLSTDLFNAGAGILVPEPSLSEFRNRIGLTRHSSLQSATQELKEILSTSEERTKAHAGFPGSPISRAENASQNISRPPEARDTISQRPSNFNMSDIPNFHQTLARATISQKHTNFQFEENASRPINQMDPLRSTPLEPSLITSEKRATTSKLFGTYFEHFEKPVLSDLHAHVKTNPADLENFRFQAAASGASSSILQTPSEKDANSTNLLHYSTAREILATQTELNKLENIRSPMSRFHDDDFSFSRSQRIAVTSDSNPGDISFNSLAFPPNSFVSPTTSSRLQFERDTNSAYRLHSNPPNAERRSLSTQTEQGLESESVRYPPSQFHHDLFPGLSFSKRQGNMTVDSNTDNAVAFPTSPSMETDGNSAFFLHSNRPDVARKPLATPTENESENIHYPTSQFQHDLFPGHAFSKTQGIVPDHSNASDTQQNPGNDSWEKLEVEKKSSEHAYSYNFSNASPLNLLPARGSAKTSANSSLSGTPQIEIPARYSDIIFHPHQVEIENSFVFQNQVSERVEQVGEYAYKNLDRNSELLTSRFLGKSPYRNLGLKEQSEYAPPETEDWVTLGTKTNSSLHPEINDEDTEYRENTRLHDSLSNRFISSKQNLVEVKENEESHLIFHRPPLTKDIVIEMNNAPNFVTADQFGESQSLLPNSSSLTRSDILLEKHELFLKRSKNENSSIGLNLGEREHSNLENISREPESAIFPENRQKSTNHFLHMTGNETSEVEPDFLILHSTATEGKLSLRKEKHVDIFPSSPLLANPPVHPIVDLSRGGFESKSVQTQPIFAGLKLEKGNPQNTPDFSIDAQNGSADATDAKSSVFIKENSSEILQTPTMLLSERHRGNGADGNQFENTSRSGSKISNEPSDYSTDFTPLSSGNRQPAMWNSLRIVRNLSTLNSRTNQSDESYLKPSPDDEVDSSNNLRIQPSEFARLEAISSLSSTASGRTSSFPTKEPQSDLSKNLNAEQPNSKIQERKVLFQPEESFPRTLFVEKTVQDPAFIELQGATQHRIQLKRQALSLSSAPGNLVESVEFNDGFPTLKKNFHPLRKDTMTHLSRSHYDFAYSTSPTSNPLQESNQLLTARHGHFQPQTGITDNPQLHSPSSFESIGDEPDLRRLVRTMKPDNIQVHRLNHPIEDQQGFNMGSQKMNEPLESSSPENDDRSSRHARSDFDDNAQSIQNLSTGLHKGTNQHGNLGQIGNMTQFRAEGLRHPENSPMRFQRLKSHQPHYSTLNFETEESLRETSLGQSRKLLISRANHDGDLGTSNRMNRTKVRTELLNEIQFSHEVPEDSFLEPTDHEVVFLKNSPDQGRAVTATGFISKASRPNSENLFEDSLQDETSKVQELGRGSNEGEFVFLTKLNTESRTRSQAPFSQPTRMNESLPEAQNFQLPRDEDENSSGVILLRKDDDDKDTRIESPRTTGFRKPANIDYLRFDPQAGRDSNEEEEFIWLAKDLDNSRFKPETRSLDQFSPSLVEESGKFVLLTNEARSRSRTNAREDFQNELLRKGLNSSEGGVISLTKDPGSDSQASSSKLQRSSVSDEPEIVYLTQGDPSRTSEDFPFDHESISLFAKGGSGSNEGEVIFFRNGRFESPSGLSNVAKFNLSREGNLILLTKDNQGRPKYERGFFKTAHLNQEFNGSSPRMEPQQVGDSNGERVVLLLQKEGNLAAPSNQTMFVQVKNVNDGSPRDYELVSGFGSSQQGTDFTGREFMDNDYDPSKLNQNFNFAGESFEGNVVLLAKNNQGRTEFQGGFLKPAENFPGKVNDSSQFGPLAGDFAEGEFIPLALSHHDRNEYETRFSSSEGDGVLLPQDMPWLASSPTGFLNPEINNQDYRRDYTRIPQSERELYEDLNQEELYLLRKNRDETRSKLRMGFSGTDEDFPSEPAHHRKSQLQSHGDVTFDRLQETLSKNIIRLSKQTGQYPSQTTYFDEQSPAFIQGHPDQQTDLSFVNLKRTMPGSNDETFYVSPREIENAEDESYRTLEISKTVHPRAYVGEGTQRLLENTHQSSNSENWHAEQASSRGMPSQIEVAMQGDFLKHESNGGESTHDPHTQEEATSEPVRKSTVRFADLERADKLTLNESLLSRSVLNLGESVGLGSLYYEPGQRQGRMKEINEWREEGEHQDRRSLPHGFQRLEKCIRGTQVDENSHALTMIDGDEAAAFTNLQLKTAQLGLLYLDQSSKFTVEKETPTTVWSRENNHRDSSKATDESRNLGEFDERHDDKRTLQYQGRGLKIRDPVTESYGGDDLDSVSLKQQLQHLNINPSVLDEEDTQLSESLNRVGSGRKKGDFLNSSLISFSEQGGEETSNSGGLDAGRETREAREAKFTLLSLQSKNFASTRDFDILSKPDRQERLKLIQRSQQESSEIQLGILPITQLLQEEGGLETAVTSQPVSQEPFKKLESSFLTQTYSKDLQAVQIVNLRQDSHEINLESQRRQVIQMEKQVWHEGGVMRAQNELLQEQLTGVKLDKNWTYRNNDNSGKLQEDTFSGFNRKINSEELRRKEAREETQKLLSETALDSSSFESCDDSSFESELSVLALEQLKELQIPASEIFINFQDIRDGTFLNSEEVETKNKNPPDLKQVSVPVPEPPKRPPYPPGISGM